MPSSSISRSAALEGLPLLCATPEPWAALAAANLETFLSDHAVCEQQAALSAMALMGQYPNDPELVDRMAALAAEEISHMRRVLGILHRRGWHAAGRRANPWAQGLRLHLKGVPEPWLKVDRLLVGALIEARSCERFTLLHEVSQDEEVRALLLDLGPAEKRHWQLFHRLAGRDVPAAALDERFGRWLAIECELAAQGGQRPTVHG